MPHALLKPNMVGKKLEMLTKNVLRFERGLTKYNTNERGKIMEKYINLHLVLS